MGASVCCECHPHSVVLVQDADWASRCMGSKGSLACTPLGFREDFVSRGSCANRGVPVPMSRNCSSLSNSGHGSTTGGTHDSSTTTEPAFGGVVCSSWVSGVGHGGAGHGGVGHGGGVCNSWGGSAAAHDAAYLSAQAAASVLWPICKGGACGSQPCETSAVPSVCHGAFMFTEESGNTSCVR